VFRTCFFLSQTKHRHFTIITGSFYNRVKAYNTYFLEQTNAKSTRLRCRSLRYQHCKLFSK